MPCLSSRTAILIAELLRHTPKVRIELSQGLQSTLLDMLARRKVDILIAMSTTRRDVHSVALETEPNFIVLPREHPLAHRKSVTADDLSPYPYVGVQRDMLSTRSAGYFFQSRGLRADPICESDDSGTLQVLVRQGVGYSLLPQSSVKEAPDLVCLSSEPMTYRQISAICSNSGVSNSVAEVFRYFATAWKGGKGQPDRRAPRSVQGKRLFGVEMKIVDEDGRSQAWDNRSQGELMVRGPTVICGYFNAPEASKAAFDEDGWFRTGDIAQISPAGELTIVDRTKDLIKSGGEWISSIELENIALSHPGVASAAAAPARGRRLAGLEHDGRRDPRPYVGPTGEMAGARRHRFRGFAADDRHGQSVEDGYSRAAGKLFRRQSRIVAQIVSSGRRARLCGFAPADCRPDIPQATLGGVSAPQSNQRRHSGHCAIRSATS